MPTRKELLLELVNESAALASSLDANADASGELRAELDSLRSELSESYQRFESLSDYVVDRLSDRLSDLRIELQSTLKQGTQEIQRSIINASIISAVMQRRLQGREDDPHRIIAKRIHQAMHILADAQNAGEHHDFNSTLRLLRVHEFKAEQARYVLELLLHAGAVKQQPGPQAYVIIDNDSDMVRKLNEAYARNELVYITRGPSSSDES